MLTLDDPLLESRVGPDQAVEDEGTWIILSRRLMQAAITSGWHPPVYVEALGALLAACPHLPGLEELNSWLAPTGWRTEYADGYVSVDRYFELLGGRCFPIAREIRRRRDLDHSAAPDFAHDVLGHLPMLFDPDYRRLLSLWASLGRSSVTAPEDQRVASALAALIAARERADRDPAEIARCSRELDAAHGAAFARRSRRHLFETFFTWAFEFGLLARGAGAPILIGGACLSSQGEMTRLFNSEVELLPFKAGAVGHPVDYTVYQPVMFIADDYDELVDELERI